MITRLVKMHFRPEDASKFLTLFDEVYPAISTFPGCTKLELWRDKNHPSIFFTHSHWDNEKSLEKYRNSALFKATWAKTKALFAEKAEAWSVDKMDY